MANLYQEIRELVLSYNIIAEDKDYQINLVSEYRYNKKTKQMNVRLVLSKWRASKKQKLFYLQAKDVDEAISYVLSEIEKLQDAPNHIKRKKSSSTTQSECLI